MSHASPQGFGALNPLLYALGQRQYGRGGAPVFHDITSGGNSVNGVAGVSASPAYDLATGWGSPDVDDLVQAVETRSCTGDCNNDGRVTIDEILTGVNEALGVMPVSACPAFDADHDGQVTLAELLTGAVCRGGGGLRKRSAVARRCAAVHRRPCRIQESFTFAA